MLLLCILTPCFFLYAQQKDLQTFKKYLQKKKEFTSPLPYLFLKPNGKEKQRILLENFSDLPIEQVAKILYVSPNGNKIYALPLDNMPCVVPDMRQFNMPVAKAELNGFIPNAAKGFSLIPD